MLKSLLYDHVLSHAPETMGCDFKIFRVTWKEPLWGKQPVRLAGQILWQVLKDAEISLKGDSCEREQGVHFFLLLWLFWNILSSLNGMVSFDKKIVSVGYLLRTHWNIWRVTSASLWNVWNVNLVSKKNPLRDVLVRV